MIRPDFNLIQVFSRVIMQIYEVQIKRKHKRYDQHFPLFVYGIFGPYHQTSRSVRPIFKFREPGHFKFDRIQTKSQTCPTNLPDSIRTDSQPCT